MYNIPLRPANEIYRQSLLKKYFFFYGRFG